MAEEDLLTRYYLAQAGSGMGDIYSGPIYQKGYGLGSFLGGLFRSVLPLLKRGGMAIGKEVLNSGANFMRDVENNVSAREAFNNRSRETLGNLKRKAMFGEGYKVGRRAKKRQLGPDSRAVKSKPKRRKVVRKKKPALKRKKKPSKKKKKAVDIFSY